MTEKEYVLSVASDATCFGPVQLYWPGTAERTAMIVTLAPYLSAIAGSGDTEDEAWHSAAERLRAAGVKEK